MVVPLETMTVERALELLVTPLVLAVLSFVGFVLLGLVVGRILIRLLASVGVPDLVEGTTFERTAQGAGSSTAAVMARLSSWFIYIVGALVALHILGLLRVDLLWEQATIFLPQLFVAVLVVIIGIVVGEKAALILTERLRGVKLPEVTIVAGVVKYSIIFLAFLIALGQIGVVTTALLVILAAYAFGIVLLTGLACKDLLTSGAAGIYLLLQEPYGIGDEIEVGDRSGIVQEVDLFVTRIESEEAEYIVPNRELFADGVAHLG